MTQKGMKKCIFALISALLASSLPASQAGLSRSTSYTIPTTPNTFLPSLSINVLSVVTTPGLPGFLAASFVGAPPRYSLNGGADWYEFATYPWETAELPIHFIGVAPRASTTNPARVIIGFTDQTLANTRLYRTGDLGKSWAEIPITWPNGCYDRDIHLIDGIYSTPANPNRIYITRSCYSHYIPEALYSYDASIGETSADAGVTFSEIFNDSVLLFYNDSGIPFDYLLHPSPVMSERVYRSNISVSEDAGATWLETEIPGSANELALDGQDANKMYLPGMTSINLGVTWNDWQTNPCLSTSTTHQLTADPAVSGTLYMRCDEGLFRSQDSGNNWVMLSSWHGKWLNPNYATSPYGLLWARNDGLWASSDHGNTWTQLTDSFSKKNLSWKNINPPDDEDKFSGLVPLNSADAWAIRDGESGATDAVLRWNGKQWEPISQAISGQFNGIDFDGANNGWIVGEISMHWNGATWQQHPLPMGTTLSAVSVTGSQAWGVGAGGKIAHWDGTQWVPANSPTTLDLKMIDMVSPTDGWAAGGVYDDISKKFDTVLLQATSSGWTTAYATDQYVFTGISALSGDNAWAIGATVGWREGHILHWDGKNWQPVLDIDHDLYAISMAAPDDGWIIGDQILMHWDGAVWDQLEYADAAYTTAASIANLGPRDYWMNFRIIYQIDHYGQEPVVYHFTGPGEITYLPVLSR